MDKIQSAWAIKLGVEDGIDFGFIGHYWFTDHIDDWQDGNRKSLFRTRSQARYHMNRVFVKNTFPNAKIVKVKVSIHG